MMKLTGSLHVSIDYPSRGQAMRMLSLLTKLTPYFIAISANSAYKQGRQSGFESQRVSVWHDTDPDRCGVPDFIWEDPSLEGYLHWALNAPVYFIRRGDDFYPVFERSFKALAAEAFEIKATQGDYSQIFLSLEDWRRHLGTLFPWVRLKDFLEVRAFDALPVEMALACSALVTMLFYDQSKWEVLEERFGAVSRPELMTLLSDAGKKGLSDDKLSDGCKFLLSLAKQPTANTSTSSWWKPELIQVLEERVEDKFVPSSLSLEETIRRGLV